MRGFDVAGFFVLIAGLSVLVLSVAFLVALLALPSGACNV